MWAEVRQEANPKKPSSCGGQAGGGAAAASFGVLTNTGWLAGTKHHSSTLPSWCRQQPQQPQQQPRGEPCHTRAGYQTTALGSLRNNHIVVCVTTHTHTDPSQATQSGRDYPAAAK